jgi:hypothetical protein
MIPEPVHHPRDRDHDGRLTQYLLADPAPRTRRLAQVSGPSEALIPPGGARAASLLRQPTDPTPRIGQDRPGTPRARERFRNPGHPQPPLVRFRGPHPERCRCCAGNLADSSRTGRVPNPRTAGQTLSADGLAHRPGSVRRPASRRHGWRPSISECRCRHPPATYPRARTDRPRTLAVWSCSRWGLPSHDGLPPRWWSLAPPFHPYRCSEERRRSVFCGTDPAGHPGWVLPTTLSCGARTFLDTSRLPAW